MVDSKPRSTRISGAGSIALVVSFAVSACTGMIQSDKSESENGTAGSANPAPGTGSGGAGSVGAAGGSNSAGASAGAGTTTTLQPFSPAAESLHRLTKSQFENSMTALLGNVTLGDLDDDSYIGGFATVGAGSVVTSPDGVQDYQIAVDAALDQVFADTTRRAKLLGCTPKTPLDNACSQTFVTTFGRLAWRRPLTDAQIQRETKLAMDAATLLSDPYGGLKIVASAILQSPYFLYRSERGTPVPGFTDRNQYTPYELASKLSFFLWNSTPDSALLDAAESGALATAAGVSAQVDRLLASPQGHEAIVNFAREFMRTDNLPAMAKDATTYPSFSPTLSAAMGTEVLSLWENATFESDSNALDLFTTQQTFVNKELGAMYGLDTSGLSATTFSQVTLPASQERSGLLTTAAMLSLQGTQIEGSPTLRGRFIRQQFQCLQIPEPPPGIVTTLPDVGPGVFTKRQKMATHESQPVCAACHGLMDPVGFALEHFDAIGAYRATDSGLPIDTTGSMDGQPFAGSVDMGKILAASPDTAPCMVKNLYTYAVGHQVPDTEQIVVSDLSSSFSAAGNRLRGLILKIVASDGFTFVSPESL
jgi:Protein of unknown function (DUF1592)/Protein of unknown function (DUF1588)/Protein of unknown function (DUF1595)/Protein of unknown function (DUF1585)/Protein of unknown function (DUF1587)